MTTIVTRAGKGSPLTNNEMDANLTNLNNVKLEVGALANPTNVVSINSDGILGRNALMNSDQRRTSYGTTTTLTAGAALAYVMDRWWAACTGANVVFAQVAGSGSTKYLAQFTGAASVTGIQYGQRIESTIAFPLASANNTFSVELANSLLTTVTWTAYYADTTDTFGTLASPTKTQIATGTFTVTSTLTKYSATIAVPANAINGIEIILSVGAQTSGTFQIGKAQWELGSVATQWRAHIGIYGGDDFACLRYVPSFNNSIGGTANLIGNGSANSTSTVVLNILFTNSTRAPVTGIGGTVIANPTYVSIGDGVSGYTVSAVAFSDGGINGADLSISVSTITLYRPIRGLLNNSSATLYFTGAEL